MFEIYGRQIDLDDEDNKCPTRTRNITLITNVYEGIPETVIFVVVLWALLWLTFSCLKFIMPGHFQQGLTIRSSLISINQQTSLRVNQEPATNMMITDSSVMFGWIFESIMMSKQTLLEYAGSDAICYLTIQNYMILLMCIICIFSLVIILPVNLRGTTYSNKYIFALTTIGNLRSQSGLIWVHVLVSIGYAIVATIITHKCFLDISKFTKNASSTIMIWNIPKTERSEDSIYNHIKSLEPDVTVLDIYLTYPVKKLIKLNNRLSRVKAASTYCSLNPDLEIKQKYCFISWPCFKTNADEYYKKQEAILDKLVTEERNKAYTNPLGVAFVNLATPSAVDRFIQKHHKNNKHAWVVEKASSPDDINWKNLESNTTCWYLKAGLINFTLIVFLIFLTTPALITKIICRYSTFIWDIAEDSPILEHLVPSLILLIVSSVMPDIVMFTDKLLGHWTKSKENNAIMFKTFITMTLVILILPSLGLSNINRVLNAIFIDKDIPFKWECIFLADSGAFFTNYIATVAWLKPSMHLFRLGDLCLYIIRLLSTRSKAEVDAIRYRLYMPFPVGIHYAHLLLIFTVISSYSIICPLITPFGLVFLILKRVVDKYNFLYNFKPLILTQEAHDIHLNAISLTRVSIIFQQCDLFIFLAVREIGSTTTLVVFVTMVAFVGLFLSDRMSFKQMSDNIASDKVTVHIPDVLRVPT